METYLGPVLDALPAMVWTALPDGRFDFANRRWSDYTGLSEGDERSHAEKALAAREYEAPPPDFPCPTGSSR